MKVVEAMLASLRRVFHRGPRLEAAAPEERIAAIDKLDAADQEAIARLFLHDGDPAVRLAALGRLTALAPLEAGLEDPALSGAVAERLAAVLDEDGPVALRQHPLVCRAMLAGTAAPAAAVAAAGFVSSAERATALAENVRPEVRLAVAEAAWQPDFLAALERAMRSRDKNVLRLARERLADLKTASAARDREDEETAQLVAAAAALDDDDAHYDARRDAIERDWKRHLAQLAATDAALARFGIAARDLEATRGRLAARRTPPKPVRAASDVDFEPMIVAASALGDSIRASWSATPPAADAAELRQAAEALRARWNAAADAEAPGEAASSRFRGLMTAAAELLALAERATALAEPTQAFLDDSALPEQGQADAAALERELGRLAKTADKLLRRFAWPEDAPPPPLLAALRERRAALTEAARRCADQTAAGAERIAADIAVLRRLVDDGAASDAVALERKLRDAVQALPPEATRRLGADLAAAGARLRELRDWRNFAELPRRQALCEQMEALAESPLPAQEQAEAVKALRQRWNDLGLADSHKLWQVKKRFDRAAETAFEPCREHFKEQAAQRAFNLEQRQAIVAALERFLADNDWQHADWPGVDRVLRQARAEWRRYYPMDRKAGRSVAMRFDAVTAEIGVLLQTEWDRNVQRKEALVVEAAAVRESGRNATDKANAMKGLQQRWKETGPTPHKVGQQLWKQFRAECDVVFEARNVVRDQRKERYRAIEEAETLIDELERRADIDPALDRSAVADFQQRLDDLQGLPNELRRRAASVVQHAERALLGRR